MRRIINGVESAEDVASNLVKGKREPDGSYKACCPAHPDETPSLSLADGIDKHGYQIVLVTCHAGCSQSEVINTLKGMNAWPEYEQDKPVKKKLIAEYDYVDENGVLLYQALRYEPKDFRQRAPNPKGGWNWSLKGVRLVPYRLPEIIQATKGICLVEGEKDADNLSKLGIIATSAPMGANKWRDSFTPYFKDKTIYLIPDNDDQGKKHMEDVALKLMGVANTVKIIYLPDLKNKEDVSDWLAKRGGTKAKLTKIIADTKEYKPEPRTITVSDDPPEYGVPANDSYDDVIQIDAYRSWENPVDIFAKLKPPTLDVELLPVQIQEFVKEYSEVIGIDPGIIGMSALVTCASAIHDGITIQPKQHEEGWTESARLWGAVVGDPSVKKSPGIKKAVSPLRKIDLRLGDETKSLMHEYSLEEKIHKKMEAKYIKEAELNGGKPEGPAPEKPDHPECPRAIVEDSTIEALRNIMQYNNRGILCLRDELSGWFGSMDAYSGGKGSDKDRPLWLEAYNGGARNIDRVSTGTTQVPNWSVCILGGIQPGSMQKIASKLGDDGLLQRFMIIMAGPSNGGADRPIDENIKGNYDKLVQNMFETTPATKPVLLSNGAQNIRKKLQKQLREFYGIGAMSPPFLSHLSKWEGLFPRLLLTYHVIECAANSQYPTDKEVTEETAERVYRFLMEYIFPHSGHFYIEILNKSDHLEHSRWMAGYILSRKLESITVRDIMRNYRQMRGKPAHEINNMMVFLESSGWVKAVKKSGGTPTSWLVNPQIHRTFETIADEERVRRTEARRILSFIFEKMGKKNETEES